MKEDLCGQKFGRLTVVKQLDNKQYPKLYGRIIYECLCDCGNTTIVTRSKLLLNHTKSCGCLRKSNAAQLFSTHKQTGTRLFNIFYGIKQRCCNPNAPAYPKYGGRGITLCDEWNNENGFENFYNWAMQNDYQENLSIDRINNDGNYAPDNCRWTTMKMQSNNRSNNSYITYHNQTHTLSEWADIIGIDHSVLSQRINKLGMSIEEAFTHKVNFKNIPIDIYKEDNYIMQCATISAAAKFIGVSPNTIMAHVKTQKPIKEFIVTLASDNQYAERIS